MADAITTAEQSFRAEAPAPAYATGRSETVELSRTHCTIAERMHASLPTMAQLKAVVEVDMTRLVAACVAARDSVWRRTGVPLTPLAPTANALRRVPGHHQGLNASIELEKGRATYQREVHRGISVDIEQAACFLTDLEHELEMTDVLGDAA